MCKRADGSLAEKDLLEDWFLKIFALEKEIRGKAIGDSNRHKRLAKRIYAIFRGREPWIPINKS